MNNNKPFIDYNIKSSHNSYLFTSKQVNYVTIFKSFFGFRNKPVDNNYQLNNHLKTLLQNNFKFLEFDLSNSSGNIVIQHTTNIYGKNYSVSKAYDFEIIMKNLVNYLNSNYFDTPIFIYFECNFDNNSYNELLSKYLKTIFYKYILDNTNIDYTKESPFDDRFKNKIIFVSSSNYYDKSIISSNILYPNSTNINNNNIYNFSYSDCNTLKNYNNIMKRIYVENVISTTNQPFNNNCNIFSINYLPNEKNYIEYNNIMKSGYILK